MATQKTEQYWRLDEILAMSPSGVVLGDLRTEEGGALRANTRTATWLLNDNAVIDGFSVRKPWAGGYNQWKTDGTRARLIERVAKLDNGTVVKFTGKPPRARRNANILDSGQEVASAIKGNQWNKKSTGATEKLKSNSRTAAAKSIDYFFYNTDERAILEDPQPRFHVMLENDFAAAGGARKYGERFEQLTPSDILLMYENHVGVVALGRVIHLAVSSDALLKGGQTWHEWWRIYE